ncbi:MAG: DUF6477 family protein [Pseudomonadota bacterium]
MQDTLTMLAQIKRPGLLLRAARLGAEDYRRAVHLPRLLGYGQMPRHTAALLRLIEIEAEHNAQRLNDPSTYSLVRHLDVLIAIVGEARTLRAAQ